MNKILEYMALEKATVQFDLVEGRRSAGDAVVYARPNEVGDLAAKIVALLDDPRRRARMGAEGRRRVEERLEWRHQALSLGVKAPGRRRCCAAFAPSGTAAGCMLQSEA
jgi:glycosyltransferase involved in cell wall biosynthesis